MRLSILLPLLLFATPPLAACDPVAAAIRGDGPCPSRITTTSLLPMPTPIYDEPQEDATAVELRKLRREIRQQAQRVDVARQNAENDRRQEAAWRSLDRIQDGLDRDSEALKARRAAEDADARRTVFDARGNPHTITRIGEGMYVSD